MFDSTTFTKDMLSNPSLLAKTMIDAMESTDTKEPVSINDPNNGFVMQMFGNMCVFSKFSEKIDSVTSTFYSRRARNAEQLYPHLSEFDYVNLMASPATLPFVFALDRNYIINNSVYYDSNYNKLEIPATSAITMGGVIYSMYHPIEILVNRNTGAITAFYDGGIDNSLNTLSSNMLIDVQEYTKDGIPYFQMVFNMYQFRRVITPHTVVPEQGFIKTINYEDQFYAIKVFSLGSNGVWKELAYSLTQLYYDYKTPTVVLSLLTDTSQLKVEIPQIYFDNGQIGQNIRIEMYTTKGAVNYSLSPADVQGLTANFDTSSSKFAAPLVQPSSYILLPTTLEIEGGSNVKSYAEIRDAVVNQRLYDRVAVTTPEIIEAGKKAGFDLTRITDDLTERVYYAANVLTDSNDMVVPTFAGNILIAGEALEGNPSSIINYSDGYKTILPTTTFTIANSGLTVVPMTDGQVAAMGQLTKTQLVAELNKGTYVRQPFHITLTTQPKSPQALIYNLLSPTMTSLIFVEENAHSAPQMSVTACIVNHLNSGTGGYQILMGVTRSSNIETADAANFEVFLTCITKSGSFAYIPAVYNGTNSNGVDVWRVQLSTSYRITTDDYLSVMMYENDGGLNEVDIPLNQTFTVVTAFVNAFDTSVPVDQNLNGLLPALFQATHTAMAQQTMTLSLGRNLSGQIYCGVNTKWGNEVYKTADETIYYGTNVPIFQTREDGIINTRVNPTTGNAEIVVIYPQNSVPSDTQDITCTTTALTLAPPFGTNTTVFSLDTVVGLLIGMPVRGLNIPVDAVITAINGTYVTISKDVSDVVPKDTKLVFTNKALTTPTITDQPAKGRQLTVADTQYLIKGKSVFGFDIPADAKIASVDSLTQFTLTVDTLNPVKAGTLLTIINTTAPGVIKVEKGDVVTDVTGTPVVVQAAKNQYMIPAILFDGRLFASDDVNDLEIVNTISQRLQNFANQISTIDAGLIEDSDVFYKPSRTMGYATFGIGGGRTILMPLELSFSVIVYVDASVYNTQTLLSTMTNAIIAIINKAIQLPIISISEITDDIRESLGANVAAVEMGPISNRTDLRLVALEETGATPSIENLLSIQSDGSITRAPNIKIEYKPKPDTSIRDVSNLV